MVADNTIAQSLHSPEYMMTYNLLRKGSALHAGIANCSLPEFQAESDCQVVLPEKPDRHSALLELQPLAVQQGLGVTIRLKPPFEDQGTGGLKSN